MKLDCGWLFGGRMGLEGVCGDGARLFAGRGLQNSCDVEEGRCRAE